MLVIQFGSRNSLHTPDKAGICRGEVPALQIEDENSRRFFMSPSWGSIFSFDTVPRATKAHSQKASQEEAGNKFICIAILNVVRVPNLKSWVCVTDSPVFVWRGPIHASEVGLVRLDDRIGQSCQNHRVCECYLETVSRSEFHSP